MDATRVVDLDVGWSEIVMRRPVDTCLLRDLRGEHLGAVSDS
jgi:hypothetical protein